MSHDVEEIYGKRFSDKSVKLINPPNNMKNWVAYPMLKKLKLEDLPEEYEIYFKDECSNGYDYIEGIIVTPGPGPMWNDDDPSDGWQLIKNGKIVMIYFKPNF